MWGGLWSDTALTARVGAQQAADSRCLWEHGIHSLSFHTHLQRGDSCRGIVQPAVEPTYQACRRRPVFCADWCLGKYCLASGTGCGRPALAFSQQHCHGSSKGCLLSSGSGQSAGVWVRAGRLGAVDAEQPRACSRLLQGKERPRQPKRVNAFSLCL